MRADALRNRARIVATAQQVFREQGLDAPLDEIAKRAEVGPGTLYRHFPTREALLDAIMQSWVEKVGEEAEKALVAECSPRDRILRWFESYTEMLTNHRGAAARITAALGDDDSPIRAKCQVYFDANERVIEAMRDLGALRDDVEALQVARLVGGVAAVADQGQLSADDVRPMLEVVADGLLRADVAAPGR